MLTLWIHRFFHLSVFSAYSYAFYRHHFIIPPQHAVILGPYKFLTIWNLIIHTVMFGIFTLNNFLPYHWNLRKKLVAFSDAVFTSVALPYGMMVVFFFWTLFYINRDLIFPVQLERVYPSWLNHLAHTFILPVALLELYISHHPHRNRLQSISMLLLFGASYLALVLFLGLRLDVWVYPVLRVLSWPYRIAFLLLSMVTSLGFYMVGEVMNSLFWRKNKATRSKRK